MLCIQTYSPLIPQNAADIIRVDTCDTRRFTVVPCPVQPLKGLQESRAAAVFYRASVPTGHGAHGGAASYRALAPHEVGTGHRVRAGACGPRPTANYSLLTANSLTYTFSAKERDSETGLSYFGSRYYSSDLSIWLSVDPMAAKYPSLSPYVYCANNPVKLVDPNGEEIDDNLDKWKYIKQLEIFF